MIGAPEIKLAFEHGNEDEAEKIAGVEDDIAALIDDKNRWHEPGELTQEQVEEMEYLSSRLLYAVMLYLTDGVAVDTLRGLVRMLVRMLAIVWVLAPQLLRTKDGKIAALKDMALPLDVSRCWISMVGEDASVCFGFFGRNQKSAFSRQNYATATKAAWKKRREAYDEDKIAGRQANIRVNGVTRNKNNSSRKPIKGDNPRKIITNETPRRK